MSRTCAITTGVLALDEDDSDKLTVLDERVCGEPAVTELTVGPRPFRYVDVCAKHSELHRAGDVGVQPHPIPEALR